MAKLYSDYKNILEIENFDDIFEIEKPKIERVYRPPLHKGTKCDMRFKSSLNSAKLNLLNPYK